MLGLILIYFIGRWFYNLADKYKKNKWIFAILGVVVYYGCSILGAMAILFIAISAGNGDLLELPDVVIGLMGVPIGLLAMWGFHTILRKNWEKEVVHDATLLDDEL